MDRQTLAPVGAVLIHILDKPLGAVLRRLRLEEARGPRVRVNRVQISFALSAGQPLEPSGSAFRRGIAAACPASLAAYMRVKAEQLRTLGYEPQSHVLTATMQLGSREEFVDVVLGLRSATVANLRTVETRFGIALPLPMSTRGELHVSPEPIIATLTMREAGLSPPVRFVAEVTFPPIPGLEPDEFKFLIRTRLFTITI